MNPVNFIEELEEVIRERMKDAPEGSYTRSLVNGGRPLMARKVGEEAVELVVEALGDNDERFYDEAADLVYHLLVLLNERGGGLDQVASVLRSRHEK